MVREIEFEVGDDPDTERDQAAATPTTASLRRSPLPWVAGLAVTLIGAGLALAQQAEPLFTADEPSVRHYLIQDADGGVHTWSWHGEAPPDQTTAAQVDDTLATMADVADWTCLPTADPDAPPGALPGTGEVTDPGVTCTGPCVSGVEGGPPRCETTVWIPPEGWQWPTDEGQLATGRDTGAGTGTD